MCQECREVATAYDIDLERLFKDLARMKAGRRQQANHTLSEQEKKLICLSLLGRDPLAIAREEREEYLYTQYRCDNPRLTEEEIKKLVENKLKKRASDIRSFMSTTINGYIKDLINTSNDIAAQAELRQREQRALNWLRILVFLLQNGYKTPQALPIIEIEYKNEVIVSIKSISNLMKIIGERYQIHLRNVVELLEQELEEDDEPKSKEK